ncbi:MAG: protein tyrosine phosphatase [Deltaproteobacteria bacterium]|jgi:protein-tyrosine phosphatase|nr:protein tyrosine phosphatase [Deltaproteobacteria bacterium]MBW2532141.1 protein tyrosine phosphatase [Deltaproteobacteria bacterium]
MRSFVDIHSHWIPGVDDGAATADDSIALLRGLRDLGFDRACATPHMRPGLFDNTRETLERAYRDLQSRLVASDGLPEVALSCEHHLDDVVFERLLGGEGLPYPAGKTVLIELPYDHLPTKLPERLFELRLRRLRPVLAHPERYRPVWRDIEVLDPLLDGGTVLQLDVGALAGQYGRHTRRCAEDLAEAGYYYCASSDLHRVADLRYVDRGIRKLFDLMGKDESEFLLREGPRSVLDGQVED